MRTICLISLITFASIQLLCSVEVRAVEKPVSPHAENGDCAICHVAPLDQLHGWFVSSATKKAMKNDYNRTCQQCHTVQPTHAGGFSGLGIGHAIGKVPKINTANLPLAADGTITCAITCHTMHESSGNPFLQRKRLRLPTNELCKSCHRI